MIDHYKTLGLESGASKEDVRQAFRRCAMRYHPDRNGSSSESQEKFKQCKAAYDALVSPASQPAQAGLHDLHDLFNSMFGHPPHRAPRPALRGQDVVVEIRISLRDAVVGRELNIEVPAWQRCALCADSATQVPCRHCRGHGYISTHLGLISMRNECQVCHGRGTTAPSCARCEDGLVNSTRKLRLFVPPGVSPGLRLRVAGAGRPGSTPECESGDLLVRVDIAEHPVFERVGQDLYCRVDVPATVAALGGIARLEWIDGTPRDVTIPAGSSHGTRIRIKGAGVPGISASSPGDLFCDVHLSMPKVLTGRQKRLLQEFNATLG